MMDLLLATAVNPKIPLAIAIFLYIWIALGSFLIKKPDMGGMWMCYAFANAFMLWHYYR